METSFTFSDVMFEPQYSKCKSRSVDVDLTSKVGKLELSLPLISANMADITEASMIFSMEESGGLWRSWYSS
jgi:IMP dehydrogenase